LARSLNLVNYYKRASLRSAQFLGQFLGQRASSQKLLGEYLAAREKSREFDAGSESYLTTNAAALEMLENLVAKYAPMQANGENIAKIHNHKDKHIFKVSKI